MKITKALAALCACCLLNTANATLVATPTGPFTQLDDQFTAEFYSNGANGIVGLGWLADGRFVRTNGSGGLFIHSPTADLTINGTGTLHSATFQPVAGFAGFGYGVTLGDDGYLYGQSSAGLQRINPATFTATTVPGSTGGYYGVKTLPDGKVVYNAVDGWVHTYNPATGIDSRIYFSGQFNDDLAVSPDGHIFVAVLGSCRTDVITGSGALVSSSVSAHCADGMAFGNGSIFKNNTDGTVTRLNFAGPGFTGLVTEDLIATGFGYGDLAAVGPDGSFYITGTNFKYANGVRDGGWGVVRISALGGGGFGDSNVPEPASLALALGALGLLAGTRRRAGRR